MCTDCIWLCSLFIMVDEEHLFKLNNIVLDAICLFVLMKSLCSTKHFPNYGVNLLLQSITLVHFYNIALCFFSFVDCFFFVTKSSEINFSTEVANIQDHARINKQNQCIQKWYKVGNCRRMHDSTWTRATYTNSTKENKKPQIQWKKR